MCSGCEVVNSIWTSIGCVKLELVQILPWVGHESRHVGIWTTIGCVACTNESEDLPLYHRLLILGASS